MGLNTAAEIGATGLSAQRRRLELLVSNLVNANTTQEAGKSAYRRKDVLLAATPVAQNFGQAFDAALGSARGVEVAEVVEDRSEPVRRYEPGHPHADADGFVKYPNVNAVQEMVNVLSATRSYEANLQVVLAAKEMNNKSLEIVR
jgi:flagellar basal-body rod protein FlgC